VESYSDGVIDPITYSRGNGYNSSVPHARGRKKGGVMFGIGHTLFEELVYQDGQLINANLVDYRLPKFCDLPQSFTSIIHEQGGGPGPYGAKGMGDGGVVAVAAAVCNGVYNAIGVRFHEVPLRAERVW